MGIKQLFIGVWVIFEWGVRRVQWLGWRSRKKGIRKVVKKKKGLKKYQFWPNGDICLPTRENWDKPSRCSSRKRSHDMILILLQYFYFFIFHSENDFWIAETFHRLFTKLKKMYSTCNLLDIYNTPLVLLLFGLVLRFLLHFFPIIHPNLNLKNPTLNLFLPEFTSFIFHLYNPEHLTNPLKLP